jgi:hypothetical protein
MVDMIHQASIPTPIKEKIECFRKTWKNVDGFGGVI